MDNSTSLFSSRQLEKVVCFYRFVAWAFSLNLFLFMPHSSSQVTFSVPVFMVLFFYCVIGLALSIPFKDRSFLWRWGITVADGVMLGFLISATGGSSSPFYPYLYLSIVFFSVRLHQTSPIAVVGLLAVIYGVACYIHGPEYHYGLLAFRCAVMLVIGMILKVGFFVFSKKYLPSRSSESLEELPESPKRIDFKEQARMAYVGKSPDAKDFSQLLRSSGDDNRILIVDDAAELAMYLQIVVQQLGYETKVAQNGPDAIKVFAEFQPAIVLLDLGLPGMDGFEVAQTLKKLYPNATTKLIAITGYGSNEDKRRALSCGFDVHLTKPVFPQTLKDLLPSLHKGSGTYESENDLPYPQSVDAH